MYFRLTKTRSTSVLQLVRSYRDQENKPRQKILLSLGSANIPKDLWKQIAEELDNRLSGIITMFPPSKEVEIWVEQLMKMLIKKEDVSEPAQNNNITINPKNISHSDTTELGPLLPVMKAWKDLRFPSILSDVGFNPQQIKHAGLSIMSKLLDPCSENSLPAMIKTTSFEDLLGSSVRSVTKDRFYRIADLLYKHKESIELALRQQECSLFNLKQTIVLYDLTNTYFEGECKRNPKAKRGASKEKRFDAPLLSVGLVLDSEGFIIRHDLFDGNSHDNNNLLSMIHKLHDKKSGCKAPLIVLDSGLASEKNLTQLKEKGFDYIVAGKRSKRLAYTEEFSSLPFKTVKGREGKNPVEVAIKDEKDERIVICYSLAREAKEKAIFSQAERRYLEDLKKLNNRLETKKLTKAKTVQEALGRLSERHPRVARYYQVKFNEKEMSLSWSSKDEKHEAAIKAAGYYCLRSSRKDLDDQTIWNLYITLTRVESGFRTLKTHLGLRPVYHHREDRCDSHIFITVLAYRLLHYIEHMLKSRGDTRSWCTIRRLLKTHAYTTIALLTTRGRQLYLRVPGIPEKEQRQIYELLGVKYKNLPRRRLGLN